MDDIVNTTVQVSVGPEGSLLGLVDVTTTASVELPLESWHHEGADQSRVRQDSIDHHGLHNLGAHVRVPVRHVVVERSLDVLRDEVGRVLGHITVDQKQQDTCVEELGRKHSVRDGCQLL